MTSRYYLNKREGKLMGVCAGFADYTGIDPLLVRVGAILLTVCLCGPAMILLYLLTGWLASDRAA
ncbi:MULTISPECIES: PspC domain-containing protein [Sphingomonadales]|uniref:PspC domain-containing protein n=2 Tax=Edaphosphingomonas TaxID=3423724 RepID=A0A2T4I7Y2_9SPHN|nr:MULTISPECIES: PspC domain-containing protein [Sphingomonas]AGH49296.1 phage shock protein PspC [Sphingomonas sp. MM-1]MDX3886204.1 PspC domain-containing protein [Sphingomonas sp.]OHT21933.1 PspC domain protein [Sphingomonas haloaromaticamans]PTD27569.1 PspC domain-containing protein [Sphingomonas fennica]